MVWLKRDHRAYVSSNMAYDFEGALFFSLLTLLGLRESDYVLDIGCGSLRAGRLLIPFLQRGHYYGLEPDEQLVRQGIGREIGYELVRLRAPVFVHNPDFRLEGVDRRFDCILAQSIFSHASGSQVRACLALVAEVLDEGGVFLATYYAGDTSYAGDAWVYPGHVQYRPDDLENMVAAVGLRMRHFAWPHPKQQSWVMIARSEQALAEREMEERELLLAERAGHLVTKQELLDGVWRDTAVGDAVLATVVREIRSVLGAFAWPRDRHEGRRALPSRSSGTGSPVLLSRSRSV
jgi:SAM-dependent methyltransferase